jgi:hypothetical protein
LRWARWRTSSHAWLSKKSVWDSEKRRYVIFQMAEVAIARQTFQEILRLIAELWPQPPPALA